ncbi:MAG: CoA ester lyase [Rhodospirillaceae bacterium]|nr:CoA ester lyase [Rhodospirillaceae bacterium]
MSVRSRRTILFAPGTRADMQGKALASGADAICLDLEDAVAPHLKAEARAASVPFLAAGPGPERVIRINSPRSVDGLRDLLAIVEARPTGGIVFLPKVVSPGEVRGVDDIFTEAGLDLGLGVLIETAEGLAAVDAIFAASKRIVFGLFGAVDLSAELAVPNAHEPLLYARSKVVHAARLAGIDVYDVPSLDFQNLDGLRQEAETAKALGFTGKGVLHPGNIAIVNEVFTPTAAEVARAEAVIKAYRESKTGLAIVDGKLVEKPVVRSMERILALRDAAAAR